MSCQVESIPFVNRIVKLLFPILFFSNFGLGQQLPVFNQYREYQSYINPASVNCDYLTYDYNVSIGASYRRQWINLPYGPKNLFLRGEYILKSNGRFDLIAGSYILKDDVEPISSIGAYGRIGVIMKEHPGFGGISAGFTLGGIQYRVKANEINFLQPEPNISDFIQSKIKPDLGFGIYYFKQLHKGALKGDNIYAGISMPQINSSTIEFLNEKNDFNYNLSPHLFLIAGYYRYLNESSYLEPSIWFRYSLITSPNIALNLRYHYNNVFWLGAGYDTSESLHTEVGLNISDGENSYSNIKIGYGFDSSIGRALKSFGSSHELNLSFCFDSQK